MIGKFSQYVIALGRVPMFFYIVHIYFIHILALIAALATGYSASDMTFSTWVTDSVNLKGYGFNLGVTYVVWIGVILILYPACLWYDRYKTSHKEKWWLSYL
jgi:ABC-type spermidine/putrescine transport system permease subunit I